MGAPPTLPADFFSRQAQAQAKPPDTLPADFFSKQNAQPAPTQGPHKAGFWESLGDTVNPMPALREWMNRPSGIGHAADALQTLDKIHKEAAADPANKGLPPNKWKLREPTEAERVVIDRGMNAGLPGAEGNILTEATAPAVKAGQQVAEGNLAGAAGTLTGGYVAPIAVGKALSIAPKLPAVVRRAADVTGAAVKAGGKDVAIGSAKTAAGVALAKAGPLGEVGDVLAGVPMVKSGLQQVGTGLRAGFQAGREALNPKSPGVPEASPVSEPTTPGEKPPPLPGTLAARAAATNEIRTTLENVAHGEAPIDELFASKPELVSDGHRKMITDAVESPAWDSVSTASKNKLAQAIARGSSQATEFQIRKIRGEVRLAEKSNVDKPAKATTAPLFEEPPATTNTPAPAAEGEVPPPAVQVPQVQAQPVEEVAGAPSQTPQSGGVEPRVAEVPVVPEAPGVGVASPTPQSDVRVLPEGNSNPAGSEPQQTLGIPEPDVKLPEFESAYERPEGGPPLDPNAIQTTPKPHYQQAARTVKARALARWLNIGGNSYEDAIKMTPADWEGAAKEAGVVKPSEESVKLALEELKKIQNSKAEPVQENLPASAQTPAPPSKEVIQNPAVADTERAGAPEPDSLEAQLQASIEQAKQKRPQGKPAAQPAEQPEPDSPGTIRRIKTSEIQVDPARFQFKTNVGQGGAGDELRAVQKFDPEKAGVIHVWKDPANGKTYVVNGHHRVELAQRTNAPEMNVMYLDAPDAKAARLSGALINIAEGRGDSLDMAKVFRDGNITPAEAEAKYNLSPKGEKAAEGLKLSNLDPSLFSKAVNGDIPKRRAAILGTIENTADQVSVYDMLKDRERGGRRMTDDQVQELIRFAKSPQVTETQESLFGSHEMTRSLIPEKAEVSDFVRHRLAQEQRLFSAVGNESAAEKLGAEENVINADRNSKIAKKTAMARELYDKLSTSTGTISDILDSAAEELSQGKSSTDVKQRAYRQIRDELIRQADALTGSE